MKRYTIRMSVEEQDSMVKAELEFSDIAETDIRAEDYLKAAELAPLIKTLLRQVDGGNYVEEDNSKTSMHGVSDATGFI